MNSFRLALIVLLVAGSAAFVTSSAAQENHATITDADTHYAAKRYDLAIAGYRAVVESPTTSPSARAQARFGLANSLYRTGEKEQARLAWLLAANDAAEIPDVACESFLRAANLSSVKRNLEDALTLYEKAAGTINISPTARAYAAEAQLRTGQIYLVRRVNGVRQLSKAVGAFEKVITNYPEQAEMLAEARKQLVALKLEYAINGKATFRDALIAADEFLAAYPTDTGRVPTVRLIRAEALFHDSRYSDAIRDLETLQKQYPLSGRPYGTSRFLLAKCHDHLGNYGTALQEYNYFLEQVTESFSAWEERPGALFGIAMCYRARGEADKARTAFDQLRVSYPNSYFVQLSSPYLGGVK